MRPINSFNIRLLTLDDLEEWLLQCQIVSSESGENNVYFGAYSVTESYPTEEIKKNTIERWSKTTDTPGWRRAWGIFDSDRIIGSADIAGGDLPTNLHRVDFGIGIMKEYRNIGLGSKLINVIIDWCKEQPNIFWIDLGIFSCIGVAEIVFKKNGFKKIGFNNNEINDILGNNWFNFYKGIK